MAGDYGLGADAYTQRHIASNNIYYAAGDRDALHGEQHAYVDRFYGLAFELPLLLAERVLGLSDFPDIYLMRHLLTHLFFIAGGFCCGLLAWRMFNNRWLALLAMLLFLLHPRLYAHSFFNSKDIPFAVMFIIALYLTHRAFRRDTLGAFVLLGVVVGLAVNMRPFALLLIPAVLVMLGLDWWQTPGGRRRRILLSGGIFAATALLSIYVSHPPYWENPLRFLEGFQAFSQHPNLALNMFQGQLVPSVAVPPDYIPVWFAITAPPLALLIGILGAAMICWRAWRRPRRALRRGELRFCIVLLGCFALPIAVVVALEANIYNGWRQMYFLWAPFCLLVVAGIRYIYYYLPTNLWRAAVYAAAMAMIGSAAYAVVSLHPHQQVYFNPLVDRETPERLQGQYEMNYWGASHWAGLEYLLQRYPEMPLRISETWKSVNNVKLLRDAERRRIFFVSADRADFHLAEDVEINTGRKPPGAVIHTIKFYNSTILAITATEPAAAGPEGLAELYRAEYQAIAAGELLAEGEFDVHISKDGANLVYIKADCALDDLTARFFLNFIPADERNLPPESAPRGYESRPFRFFDYPGGISGGRCAAQTPLPDYPITHIRTGQWISGQGRLWIAEIPARVLPHLAEYRTIKSGDYFGPAARGNFEVYTSENRLFYLKEQCSATDREAKFHLHIVPRRVADLPADRRQYGFDNLDFRFSDLGTVLDGDCAAIATLPDYPIQRIRTGQSLRAGGELAHLWRVEFPGNILEYRGVYEAIMSGGYREPAARGNFEVYFSENRLVYIKERCSTADREARFYLHIVPQYAADLPEDRQSGFNNLDFGFAERGIVMDDNCVAIAPLPDYPILSIRTGQFSRSNQIWRAELTGERLKRLAASEAIAVYSGREPAARSEWNVYIGDANRLVYLKESCAAADAGARFYLHIIPQDVADLPDNRREIGFENRDFRFADWGAMLDGRCAAAVGLPDYPIARIRTGQHIAGRGELWRADFLAGGN